MIKSQKLNRCLDFIFFAFLCLTAMNFNAKFFYLAVFSTLVLFVMQPKVRIDITAFVYLALSILMAVYNLNEGVLSVLRCFVYFLFYIVGYNLVRVTDFKNERSVSENAQHRGFMTLAAISIGSFIHFALNFFYNFGEFTERNTLDIWSKSTMAATGQAAIACLMIGFAVAIILTTEKLRYKFLGIIVILTMLAYNLVLACRTIIAVLLIVSIIGLIYVLKSSKSSKKSLKTIIIILTTVLIISLLVSVNFLGVRDHLQESNFFNRFSTSSTDSFDTSRTTAKLDFIKNGYKHLFGGLEMRSQFGYAHDLLLDGFDEYGLLGLIFLIVILISGLKDSLRFIKYSSSSLMKKTAYLCVYISILLTFLVEPIMEGMPWLLVCYCLINGCLRGMNTPELSAEKGSGSN